MRCFHSEGHSPLTLLPLPTQSLCAAGFWPSPCLLSDGAGADPASVLVSEPAGCSVQSAELSDEVELLNMSVTPGLVSPASDLSDRSAQAGRPELDPCEMGNSHGRGTQAIELYLGSDTQQGVGLPGGTKAEHEEDQSGSKSDARRSGGGEYGGHPDDLADQRARQPSRVENRDRWAATSLQKPQGVCLMWTDCTFSATLICNTFTGTPCKQHCDQCAGVEAGIVMTEGGAIKTRTATSRAEAGNALSHRLDHCKPSTAAGTGSSPYPVPAQCVREMAGGPSGGVA